MMRITEAIFGGAQWHTIASVLFLVSDSLLAYHKFVTKLEMRFVVLATYFGALLCFSYAAMSDMVCTKCVLGEKKNK